MHKRIKPSPTQRGRPKTNTPTGSPLTRSIGKRLKQIRDFRHYSVKALSELSTVPAGSICELEQGKKSPTADTLHKLSKALKVEMNFFLGGK